eukprot:TRINITY_DN15244_c0_g1_i6.p4 TRINITY_DN15244_c0_g1~~TRINITY_DN15244_c0_g1_i6.p4  ORF type:complete len:110 (+),score=0.06 TRINITY_DN15244_c0_g1_i6:813-1142(+)
MIWLIFLSLFFSISSCNKCMGILYEFCYVICEYQLVPPKYTVCLFLFRTVVRFVFFTLLFDVGLLGKVFVQGVITRILNFSCQNSKYLSLYLFSIKNMSAYVCGNVGTL